MQNKCYMAERVGFDAYRPRLLSALIIAEASPSRVTLRRNTRSVGYNVYCFTLKIKSATKPAALQYIIEITCEEIVYRFGIDPLPWSKEAYQKNTLFTSLLLPGRRLNEARGRTRLFGGQRRLPQKQYADTECCGFAHAYRRHKNPSSKKRNGSIRIPRGL